MLSPVSAHDRELVEQAEASNGEILAECMLIYGVGRNSRIDRLVDLNLADPRKCHTGGAAVATNTKMNTRKAPRIPKDSAGFIALLSSSCSTCPIRLASIKFGNLMAQPTHADARDKHRKRIAQDIGWREIVEAADHD